MPHLGPLEIVVILVIVVLLFGVGRIGKIGGELGRGIKEFRKAVQDEAADKKLEGKTTTPQDETKTPA